MAFAIIRGVAVLIGLAVHVRLHAGDTLGSVVGVIYRLAVGVGYALERAVRGVDVLGHHIAPSVLGDHLIVAVGGVGAFALDESPVAGLLAGGRQQVAVGIIGKRVPLAHGRGAFPQQVALLFRQAAAVIQGVLRAVRRAGLAIALQVMGAVILHGALLAGQGAYADHVPVRIVGVAFTEFLPVDEQIGEHGRTGISGVLDADAEFLIRLRRFDGPFVVLPAHPLGREFVILKVAPLSVRSQEPRDEARTEVVASAGNRRGVDMIKCKGAMKVSFRFLHSPILISVFGYLYCIFSTPPYPIITVSSA